MTVGETELIIYSGKTDPKQARRRRILTVALVLSILFLIGAGIYSIVHNYRLAQSRSREARLRSWMGRAQLALEDFADDNRGFYPGGMDAAGPTGETIKDYLVIVYDEPPQADEFVSVFRSSGVNGSLPLMPRTMPEGQVWIDTDATSDVACDATMYIIYGGGIGGRVIQLGMLYRRTDVAVLIK